MPIVRIGPKMVYFAHIPKCAGSSVEDYLQDRFGPLAMLDRQYLSIDPDLRWSRTSPQHVSWSALMRLFPKDFFSDIFTVVRHPLDRAVSAYRFQSEVEETIPPDMSFGDWLRSEAEQRKKDPHRFDNHTRPQVDFLPPEGEAPCAVFYLEHGLDALIPYLDGLAGTAAGPRAIGHALRADARKGKAFKPGEPDRALVAEIYAADFKRFGYSPDSRMPQAPAPVLTPEFRAQNLSARARSQRPLHKFAARLRRRVRKWRG